MERGQWRSIGAKLCSFEAPFALYVGAQAASRLILASCFATCLFAQGGRVPRFEDFTVAEKFAGPFTRPYLTSSEERSYRTVIRNGVSKGWGVRDGATGGDFGTPGPNFAGHYAIVTWGCGSPCLMAAIVDLRSGRVFPPPFHHGPGRGYFYVPWAFPAQPALDYRVNSRLLIANICEEDRRVEIDGRIGFQAQQCGAHYFVMNDSGPKLIRRVLDDK